MVTKEKLEKLLAPEGAGVLKGYIGPVEVSFRTGLLHMWVFLSKVGPVSPTLTEFHGDLETCLTNAAEWFNRVNPNDFIELANRLQDLQGGGSVGSPALVRAAEEDSF